MARDHPLRYLASRARLYGGQVGMPGGARSSYYGGSDDLGWRFRDFSHTFPSALSVRNRLLSWVEGTAERGSPLNVPLLYIVASVAAIRRLGRRAREPVLPVALVVVLVAMQAILFFMAGTHEFRYQYFQVALGACLCSIALALGRCERDALSEAITPPARRTRWQPARRKRQAVSSTRPT